MVLYKKASWVLILLLFPFIQAYTVVIINIDNSNYSIISNNYSNTNFYNKSTSDDRFINNDGDNMSGTLNMTNNNITTIDTGFFSSLGDILNKISNIWVHNINATSVNISNLFVNHINASQYLFNQSDLTFNFNQSNLDLVYALTTNEWLFNQSDLTFLNLPDTPDTFTGQANKCLRVASDESGVIFDTCVNGSGGDFSQTDYQGAFNLNFSDQSSFLNSTYVLFGSGNSHNNLSGIQGGASNEYYHLDALEYLNRIYLFNQSDLKYNFNQSDLTFNFNQSNLKYNFNQSDLPNLQYLFNQSDLKYNFNQSDLLYNFNQSNIQYNFNQSNIQYNFNQSDLDNRYAIISGGNSINGTQEFNGGYANGGVSIIGGSVYAQNYSNINFSQLTIQNLIINASISPLTNGTFTLGNESFNWETGYFSSDVKIDGISVREWAFNQSDLKYNFNQSDLKYNFNQSDLKYNFNQSDLKYNFNQSDLKYNINQSEGFKANFTNMQQDCPNGNYSYGVYSNGSFKCRSDENSGTGGVGEGWEGNNVTTIIIPIISTPQTAQTWSNMLYAESSMFNLNNTQMMVDLSTAQQFRIIEFMTVNGYSNATAKSKIWVVYSVNKGVTWSNLSSENKFIPINATATTTLPYNTSWSIIPDGAKKDYALIKFKGQGGDGIVDPAWRTLQIQLQVKAINQSVIIQYGGITNDSNANLTNLNISNKLSLNGVEINNTWAFNQSDLLYNFNQSNLKYNFNQSDLTFNFNQSDLTFNFNQTMGGARYQFTTNNFNGSGNFTTTGYLFGQPITGAIGSGIIWINDSNTFAEVNITCSGLNCNYSAFKVRLVNTTNVEKYCDIPAGTIAINDNQHNVLYIDNNCAVQKTSIQTYITTPISPGGIADFGNMIAYGGATHEIINGLGLENKRMIKLRKLLIQSSGQHLSVINGLNHQNNAFPSFNITSGQYVYLMDVVPSTLQNNSVEYVSHSGVGAWQHIDGFGLNLTGCETGTGTETCPDAKFRRHFIFIVGNNDTGIDTTGIHQLLPLSGTSYSTIAQCMDTTTYPLAYTLPDYYQYGAVMVWAYCGRSSDSSWVSNQWIDLRTVKSSGSSAGTSAVNYWTLNGNILNTLTGTYIVNVTELNAFNLTISGKGNFTDTLWINGVNASQWLFNQSTTSGDVYKNITNNFSQPQIFSKGLNVSENITIIGNSTIKSSQNSTNMFIDENGNMNIYIGT
jgi:hypothetical protein